jgi:RNA polymerase sigma factor (sigma-70 family)
MDTTNSEALLLGFQSGDESALDHLWTYYLPRLQRWARRRAGGIHDGMTAEDLVQEAFVRALPGLRTFQPRGPRSLFSYFCTIVSNQVRDHARRCARRPRADVSELEGRPHPGPSPLEQLLGRETRTRYARALVGLSERDRQMVVAFVEQRCTDEELAVRFAKPSRAAARMARSRAVARLAEAMA